MRMDGNTLEYVTGPVQLIGMIILVLAALVPKLAHPRDGKSRRALVWGLLGLGTLGVIGGIGLEAAKLRKPPEVPVPPTPAKTEVHVTANQVSGNKNAVGVGNKAMDGTGSNNALEGAAKAVDDERSMRVTGNTITGNGNAVGVDNVANSPQNPAQ